MVQDKAKATDFSVTFPQATPASIFPPSASDYFHFDDLLEPEERAARYKVRDFMEKEVAPIISEYWEKAEFPHELIPKFGALGIGGGTIKGYGCAELSITANAVIGVELARVDASFCSFFGVHTYMATRAIALYGTEEQKQRYLPSLTSFKSISCWAATEPEHGSQATPFGTTAKKVQGGWILAGQKRWIGNSTFADVFVVCANNTETNQTNGFIVRKGAPGLKVTKIENKIGQRIVQNGDVVFDNVFVADDDRMPGISSSQDLNRLLEVTRLMVSWQCIGIAVGVYDMCHRYVMERKQFGAPLAAFQLTQQKLVRMLSDIQAMLLVGWRLCKLYDSGKMTSGHASMGKSWISLRVREVVALGRELLGGNGILVDFLVGKAFCDLEAAHIYEGTYDINVLIVGKEVLGISSFMPPASSKRSRL